MNLLTMRWKHGPNIIEVAGRATKVEILRQWSPQYEIEAIDLAMRVGDSLSALEKSWHNVHYSALHADTVRKVWGLK